MCSELAIFHLISGLPALVFMFTCVDYPYADGSEIRFTDVTKCSKNFTTTNFDYDETLRFPIEEIQNGSGIFLTFLARGDRDAHIIFSPDTYPKKASERAYEIVIGFHGNTGSVIRSHRFNDSGGIVKRGFTLNKEWSQYWIQISPAGEIQVGKGNEKASMTWKDSNQMLMPINHYGFSGFNNSSVDWSLPCLRKIENHRKCAKKLTTSGYGNYKTFPIQEIKNENEIFLSFFVKAEKGAQVIFSPTEELAKRGEKTYEIVLGSERNTASYIRTSRNNGNWTIYKEVNIVSENDWREFWIRISSSGLIEVGKGNKISAFMKWKDDYLMSIKHYGFSSLNSDQVKWVFSCSG